MNRVLLRLFLIAGLIASCAPYANLSAKNRGKLAQLSIGMSKAQALDVMGTKAFHIVGGNPALINNPYRVEAYTVGGSAFEIVVYYTDIKARDGAITDDELTPLLFKDGELIGWGWSFWDSTMRSYNVRVRR